MKLPPISALLVPATALLLAGIAVPRADDVPSASTAPAHVAVDAAAGAPAPPPAPAPVLGEFRLDPALGRYVAPLGTGRAVLTLDPRLQARLERTLQSFAVPWGVTVLIEPATGRILAMAEHSQAEPGRRGLALTAFAPAASIFKIVTAAALLEQGIRPDEEVCYHGGMRRLQPALLSDDPRRDRSCATLERAFGHSTNVVFAKLADRGLDAALLRAEAKRFLFNDAIPFPRAVDVSKADIADSGFELANTAAGFGPVRLSPLHGALLAAIVANGGVFVPPVIVDETEGVDAPVPAAPWRVVDEAVAGTLGEMMRSTCSEGTARRAFHGARGPLRGVAVAGKTGSLADRAPFRDYSWFVGYAPADHPEIAVATVIANGTVWRTRASAVAKDALEAFFAVRVAEGPARPAPGLRTAKAPAP
ncbi:penicillin-binding transpeptidase domain-containing protein [Anaeromyxobacter oryzae]|uniref:Penicillin-binding protein n=1 Tax=Anaeromyxobacter oryzae TaxID=2918170 RepID=A0ABM7WWX2_9BACT|nr:penicillin-binding transpeptidase domain-containing protein [Anaeromyxobacter oryzae]BDG03969.1 penicillin-binding protein [Anaeromyxobacter oryzae]